MTYAQVKKMTLEQLNELEKAYNANPKLLTWPVADCMLICRDAKLKAL